MIAKTKALVEKYNTGARVVYGDSVLGHTPVLIKNAVTGDVFIYRIDELVDRLETCSGWEPYETFKVNEPHLTNKQQGIISGYLTWTHNGWSSVRRVIRHCCEKKIYRVLTETGLVDCTEDHSLLTSDEHIVKPAQLHIGQSLLHRDLPKKQYQDMYDGLFLHNSQYIDAPTQVIAQKYFVYLTRLGYLVRISQINHVNHDSNHHPYRIFFSKKMTGDSTDTVVSIDVLYDSYTTGYVYDLETCEGTFQAGIGRLIVKNTDSVFVIFKPPSPDLRHNLAWHFDMAQKAAAYITSQFKRPIELEAEKICFPFILYAKKRYISWVYEHPEDKGKQDAKVRMTHE
jgi:hypothetical protein